MAFNRTGTMADPASMGLFTPEMRKELIRRAYAGDAMPLIRTLLDAYDALRAQPSAEPERTCDLPIDDAEFGMSEHCKPAPSREAGLIADDAIVGLDRVIQGYEQQPFMIIAACQRARDRLAALQSELAQATALAEQDAKDAARYRWLRPRLYSSDWNYGDPPQSVVTFTIPPDLPIGVDLDSYIDAALASGTGAK